MWINHKKSVRPVRLLLTSAMLFNMAPVALLAQNSAPSPGEKKVLTSAIVIQNYRASFDRFVKEVEMTRDELARTDKRLGGEAESAEEVKKRMLILKTLTGKTTAIKKKVKTLEKTSRILSGVPQVRTPMKKVNKVCDDSLDKLGKLEKKLKPLYKKATGVRERVIIKGLTYRYTLLKQLDKAQKIFNQNLLNKARQTDASVTAAIYCANLNIDEDLTKLAEDLNDSSEKIAAFREVLKKINDATVDTPDLLKDINLALLSFKGIDANIDILSKLLKSISGLLKEIENFLKAKIKFGFSKKFWGKKIGFHLKFKLGQILEGPSYLFKLIEKYLGKFLFKIAKLIGVKDIIKKFINAAKRMLDKLLSKFKLDLDFKLDVSKLDDLCVRLEKLLDKLSGLFVLPDFDLGFGIDLSARLRLPYFRGLAFACANVKAVDVGITAVAAEGETAKDVPTSLNVEIRDYQNMDALNTLKGSKGFDIAAYDRKCVLTVEPGDGGDAYTEELILKAGETRTVKVPWTPVKSGTAEIAVSLSTEEIEANFENNSAREKIEVAPPDTDLAVLEIDAPEQAIPDGEAVTIRVKASNLNEAQLAEATIKVRAGEENFETSGLLLDPKSEAAAEFEWTPSKPGPVEIAAEIIPTSTRDTATDNNTLTRTIEVGAPPADLSIESFEATEQPPTADGMKLSLKLSVKNAGAGDAVPAKLTVTDDEEISQEKEITLEGGESREVAFDWTTARTSGAIQFEAELKPEATDPDEDNNTASKVVELKTKGTAELMEKIDELVQGIKALTDADLKELQDLLWSEAPAMLEKAAAEMPRTGDLDTIQQELAKLLENLKTSYERKDNSRLSALFSRQFPQAIKLMQALRDDSTFFRNPSLFYRIDSLTVSPDKTSAIASVHWELKFMLPSGRFYNKTADMNMRFAQENGEWKVAAMTNNDIFGASLFSMADLKILLSGFLTPTFPGGSMNITGFLLKNLGSVSASNFRVKATYARAAGPTYTAYASVSSIAPGGSFSGLSFTFPSVLFVPAAGDTIRIEVDPDRNIPEIKLGDNVLTVRI